MMRTSRKIRTALAGATIAGLAVITLPGQSVQAASGYDRCKSGEFCVFAKTDGQGNMCSWTGNDPDWRGKAPYCDIKKPKSVYNNGKQDDYDSVATFKKTNYKQNVSCFPRGRKANGNGKVTLSSHRWTIPCN